MHDPFSAQNRRCFIRSGLTAAACLPFALPAALDELMKGATQPQSTSHLANAKVAIGSCKTYQPSEVKSALRQCLDQLGGIQNLVKDKTVTVKINLTGTMFRPLFHRPVGESYMTHSSTAMALGSLLFGAGAKRVRFVESCNSRDPLEKILSRAGWDVNALLGLGKVELENTRNLGKSKTYAHLPVPGDGYLFTSFDVNRAYSDTDVMVSLAKLKTHVCAGITLTMKNLFGMTPNSLYGDQAGDEGATAGRGPLHDPSSGRRSRSAYQLPGIKPSENSTDPGYRVPRIVTDLCAARPIHLAIIDGITSMSGGEGPWCDEGGTIKLTTPGVIIAGLNPVSTDAVGLAVMGFSNPRAQRATPPFRAGDNHLLLAEKANLGAADLAMIEICGLALENVKYPYPG